jgi:hypothetical protein
MLMLIDIWRCLLRCFTCYVAFHDYMLAWLALSFLHLPTILTFLSFLRSCFVLIIISLRIVDTNIYRRLFNFWGSDSKLV